MDSFARPGESREASPEPAARRPRLKLLPRSSDAPLNAPVKTERNAAIFGTGKPRDGTGKPRDGTGKPRDGRKPEIVVRQNRATWIM